MEILLKIFLDEESKTMLLGELFGDAEADVGSTAELMDDIAISLNDEISLRGMHDSVSTALLDLALVMSSGVSASLIANLLYEKFKGRSVNKIIVNDTTIELTKESIEKTISIEMKKRSTKITIN